ncbi:hypothetical protein [Pseudolysinimonas kribbensis]|uniref:hypothetical protein n=1 Tax=Pseudolysinimonas kribbensis TaxID=433641 RepID=UPI0024E12229|nr:hypothetical protein [Pseudolysinimonas kribbensis]
MVFDWDGLVSVARCESCFDWVRFKIGGPNGAAAVAHARIAHGFTGHAMPLAERSAHNACTACGLRPRRGRRDGLCSVCHLVQVRERAARVRAERAAA